MSRLDDTEVAIILRHPKPGLKNSTGDQGDKLCDIVSPFFGLEYPKFVDLAKAVSHKKTIQKGSLFVLRVLDSLKHNHKINPGPFCSQLVALIYDQLDFSLFPDYLPPEYVSPNRLYSSYLHPVAGAINHPDLSLINHEELVKELSCIDRYDPSSSEEVIKDLVHHKITITILNRPIYKFHQKLVEINQALDQARFYSHQQSPCDHQKI